MKKIIAGTVLPLILAGSMGMACAQRPDDHQDAPHDQQSHDDRRGDAHGDPHGDPHNAPNFVRHDEWRQGAHMRGKDWKRGHRLDYQAYHLAPPPPGHEWREIDGNYVLASIASGVISSIIVNAGH